MPQLNTSSMEAVDEQDLAYMGIGMEASELRARSRVVVVRKTQPVDR